MRRADREVKDIDELIQIIDQCKVCRIAMQDKDGLYIVPMNYGYTYENGQLVLFFHGSKDGRKIEAMKENSNVCFEMDCEHKLVIADMACKYGYLYKSIVGNGKVVFIEEIEEQKNALSVLMKHQTGEEFEINDAMAKCVSEFKIVVSNFSGKHHC